MANIKTVVFWLVIVMSAVLLWSVVKGSPADQAVPEISYSEFLNRVEAGDVATVTIMDRAIRGKYKDDRAFKTIGPTYQDGMIETLREHKVEIRLRDVASSSWSAWFGTLAPLLFIAALWFFMIRQMQDSQKARLAGMQPSPGPSTWSGPGGPQQ